MKITKHTYERGKERMGLNKKAFERLVEKAFKEGKTHKDAKGRLQKYLNYEFLKEKKANNFKIYGEFLYFFASNTLITVVRLDSRFTKILNNLL